MNTKDLSQPWEFQKTKCAFRYLSNWQLERPNEMRYTLIKKIKIFIYKEIQMGSGAKSYLRKGFLMANIWGNAQIFSPYMRRLLVVYDFAPDPFKFPSIWGKFSFLFLHTANPVWIINSRKSFSIESIPICKHMFLNRIMNFWIELWLSSVMASAGLDHIFPNGIIKLK